MDTLSGSDQNNTDRHTNTTHIDARKDELIPQAHPGQRGSEGHRRKGLHKCEESVEARAINKFGPNAQYRSSHWGDGTRTCALPNRRQSSALTEAAVPQPWRARPQSLSRFCEIGTSASARTWPSKRNRVASSLV
eukprot:5114051-Pyramimonas_sp.AAC.1